MICDAPEFQVVLANPSPPLGLIPTRFPCRSDWSTAAE
jgi:hypothetical protein